MVPNGQGAADAATWGAVPPQYREMLKTGPIS